MAAPDRTIDLNDVDEAALLRLSPSDPADRVRATLEEIAARHKANWRDWQQWKSGLLHSQTVFAWLSSQSDSQAYESLVEFSFRSFLPSLHDSAEIRWLFDHFADSIRGLAQLEAMSDPPEARRAKDRGCGAIASMMSSAGPAGARYALAAIDAATLGLLRDWLARAWALASAAFDAAAIAEIAAVPDPAADSKRQ